MTIWLTEQIKKYLTCPDIFFNYYIHRILFLKHAIYFLPLASAWCQFHENSKGSSKYTGCKKGENT